MPRLETIAPWKISLLQSNNDNKMNNNDDDDNPTDCVPRITWGKFFDDHRGRRMMPLSVQVHHAIVDGRHVGEYFQLIETIAAHPDKYLSVHTATEEEEKDGGGGDGGSW
mmetsp:Transcript_1661/g.2286  ORF Transcript_1661/g.2286 Transcript_1661/m.2286 type:complete len:110 (+) Transcript_1661:260-589(+)